MFTLTIRYRGLCVYHPVAGPPQGMYMLLVDGRAPGNVSTGTGRHVSHAPILAVPPRFITNNPGVPRREVLDPDVADEQVRVFPLDGVVLSIRGDIVNPASLAPGSTVPPERLDQDASFDEGVLKLRTLYAQHLPVVRLDVNPDALTANDPRAGNAAARQFLTSGVVAGGGDPTEIATLRILGELTNLGDARTYREYVEYRTAVRSGETVDILIKSVSGDDDVTITLNPQGGAGITLDVCNLPLFGIDSAMSQGKTDEDYELIYRIFKPMPSARLVPHRVSELPGHLCIGGCSAC